MEKSGRGMKRVARKGDRGVERVAGMERVAIKKGWPERVAGERVARKGGQKGWPIILSSAGFEAFGSAGFASQALDSLSGGEAAA